MNVNYKLNEIKNWKFASKSSEAQVFHLIAHHLIAHYLFANHLFAHHLVGNRLFTQVLVAQVLVAQVSNDGLFSSLSTM